MTCIEIFFVTVVIALSKCDEFLDLGHVLDSDSAVWPNPPSKHFQHSVIFRNFTINGWHSSFEFSSPEHCSTHLDAPYHFYEKGWTVEQIPISHLIAPAVVIDISEKVKEEGGSASLTDKDLAHWVENFGIFPNNSIVLVQTGWDQYYGKDTMEELYFGMSKENNKLNFPGLNLNAAFAFLEYAKTARIHILGIGIDTPSLDMGTNEANEVHRLLLKENIYFIENLKDLDKLPNVGAELSVMPMKIRGGSGAPCRVVARIPSANSSHTLQSSATVLFSGILAYALASLFMINSLNGE